MFENHFIGSDHGTCEGGLYGRGVCLCDKDHSDYGISWCMDWLIRLLGSLWEYYM